MKDVHELEVYSTIEGFNDYLVTSQGRVLSLNYNRENKMRELKQRKNNCGYMLVTLFKNGKRFDKTVHRLVAQAFISNPENKTQVNHIDEEKTNNHVSNLEWVTAKENTNHGTRNERAGKTISKVSSDGRRKGKNHPRAKSIIGFKINGCEIKYYKYMKESEKDGFSRVCIRLCCEGKQKSHKDYKWFYTDEFFNKNK